MESSLEQCPLCGIELSRIKFKEIQARLREEERKNAAHLAEAEANVRRRVEQQFKVDLELQKAAAEKKAREDAAADIKKVVAERDTVATKLKQVEAREAEIRKQAQQELANAKLAGEKKAKEEAAVEIKKLVGERDLSLNRLKQAETREAEIRKQAQQELASAKLEAEKKAKAEMEKKIKDATTSRDELAKKVKEIEEREANTLRKLTEDSDKQRAQELATQRHALDKDKTLALLKQQSEFNRERESLQKKMQLMDKQLQKKTAHELGDGAEIDVYEVLRESFTDDKITRIKKGQPGADIVQEVLYKGETCGKIVFDSKNRQSWQNGFVTKLRQDQVEAGAEHAILTTTVFPAGKKELCIEAGVIVMAPGRVAYVVQLLRQAMLTMHLRGLSIKERTTKMSKLYKLITSEAYSGKFDEANQLTQDILDLDVQEQTAHSNVWKKRGALLKRIHNVLREAETDVAAIIEGRDDAEPPQPSGVSVLNQDLRSIRGA